MREHTSIDARLRDALEEHRAAHNETVAASMSLATGFLLGSGMVGAAAGVAVAYERMFPGHALPHVPAPEGVDRADTAPGDAISWAHSLIYGMNEAGSIPDPWWHQEFHGCQRALKRLGYTVAPTGEDQ